MEHSPELVHHPHQHKEGVLADTLLECVGEGRELLVRGAWVKETAVLHGQEQGVGAGRLPPSSCHLLSADGCQGARKRGHVEGTGLVQGGRAIERSSPDPRLSSATPIAGPGLPSCGSSLRFLLDFLKC